jgi:hypothetical protein
MLRQQCGTTGDDAIDFALDGVDRFWRGSAAANAAIDEFSACLLQHTPNFFNGTGRYFGQAILCFEASESDDGNPGIMGERWLIEAQESPGSTDLVGRDQHDRFVSHLGAGGKQRSPALLAGRGGDHPDRNVGWHFI